MGITIDELKSGSKTVGQLVAGDYRHASVLRKHGLDFCCGGNISLTEACEEKGLNTDEIQKELVENIERSEYSEFDNCGDMPLDQLANYILDKHHAYVKKAVPELEAYLNRVVSVHGQAHPELQNIKSSFEKLTDELLKHMQKEEMILFPHIIRIATAKEGKEEFALLPFGTIKNPITMMTIEHENAGDIMKEISDLSQGYTAPKGACMTYRVTYKYLEEFEMDLHRHIHLENNILFPNSIELEDILIEKK